MTAQSRLQGTFGVFAAFVLAAAPLSVAAQTGVRPVRVAYLSANSAQVDRVNREALRDGLRDLGYVEGRDVLVDARYADGKLDRLPEMAAELARSNPAIIVAAATPAVRAAKAATSTIPIVMAFAGNPAGEGLVSSLSRPDGNVTGFSATVVEMAGKRVELLHGIVPGMTKAVMLATPETAASPIEATERAGRALGVEIETMRVRTPAEIDRAFARIAANGAQGIVVDLLVRDHLDQILALARNQRLPTVSGPREFVAAGGLAAYGPNYPDLFRRSAVYVDRILRGAKPADLPVEQPVKFELIVSQRAARALGLTLAPSLLARADEVLQ